MVGRYCAGSLLATCRRLTEIQQRFQFEIAERPGLPLIGAFWQSANPDVKESKQITLGSSDSTAAPADFKYSMRGKVISVTYLGQGSIHEEIGRILRKIEYWHQGSVKSFRILYKDADGLGGEVKWDGENAEVVPPR